MEDFLWHVPRYYGPLKMEVRICFFLLPLEMGFFFFFLRDGLLFWPMNWLTGGGIGSIRKECESGGNLIGSNGRPGLGESKSHSLASKQIH